MFLHDEGDAQLKIDLFWTRSVEPGWISVGFMIENSFLNILLFCINKYS